MTEREEDAGVDPDAPRVAAFVSGHGFGHAARSSAVLWREGIPFAWVTRPDFREMGPLEAFAEAELQGFLLARQDFSAGAWIERLDELLAMGKRPRDGGGAGRVAEVLADLAGA